ncbi:MAG: magnesium chelatase subunit D family protein [Desulfatibacillaceae bacterium]
MSITYPFSAFVGQEMMLSGLLLNAVNPRIGGILIRGEKGTGKSTAVRALASLLPDIEVVEGCPFGCEPGAEKTLCPYCRDKAKEGPLPTATRPTSVVDLPINATEDRVAGTLDMEHALTTGEKRFEPGLLARANRGILYVDEVNLLDDHIVDILLDSAAMGVNTVEREGVGFTHPARFLLVGTMNPEEGDLRPQLLDRFGLCVTVRGIHDLDERDELLYRWEAFESDPEKFASKWKKEEAALKKRIVKARTLLPRVKADPSIIRAITDLAVRMGVDGHRADLVILKTAKTHAAFQGNREVTMTDVSMAAKFALYHRMRRMPFDEIPDDMDIVDKLLDESRPHECEKKKLRTLEATANDETDRREPPEDKDRKAPKGPVSEKLTGQEEAREIVEPVEEKVQWEDQRRRPHGMSLRTAEKGRFMKAKALPRMGRYTRPASHGSGTDIALDATFRAAAPFVAQRDDSPLAIPVERRDWRDKVRVRKTGALLVFVVDASGSMGTTLMRQTKAAILHLLDRAYKERSSVALVAFKAKGAELLLPPTRSICMAERKLRNLPTGGTTPLCSGIRLGHSVAQRALGHKSSQWPHIVLVTDGKANVSGNTAPHASPMFAMPLYEEVFVAARKIRKESRIRSLVIDTEEKHPGNLDMAREIAEQMGARYMAMADLRPENIVSAVMR